MAEENISKTYEKVNWDEQLAASIKISDINLN
jgi:hypothetical protein